MREWFIVALIIVVVAIIISSWLRGSDWIEEWWHVTLLVVFAAVAFFVWQAWQSAVPAVSATDAGDSTGSWWYLVSIIIATVCILAYRWLRGDEPPIWVTVIAICAPLFLWGCWLIQPEWYLEWRHSGYFLWTIIVVGVLGWLADNEEEVVARVARVGLLLLLLIVMGIGAYSKWPNTGIPLTATTTTTPTPGPPTRLPANMVLPIIAECESGGQQFEADGVTPKQNPTSTAIGKYQIMSSLHEEKAKGMGMDIRTLEGNEAYAKFLYETSGTLHWEADLESKACWEPKLLAFGYRATPTTLFTDFNLVVKPGEPGKLTIPVMWRWDWAGPIPKGWTTNAYMDTVGNRIQMFEVVSPATEVVLPVRLIKCATQQECAW
ncbi:MAG: hypothetical protein A3C70_02940 [Candidatus Zambryskibacteria bacterium RIFCSPHIGHO2_02_FULL_43_14]|uniref:Uncharacterized protein n=1 Tax=Candidatus Zambryskibacteria bacterium RIFCSPHIGHO2_02_FULL_43_14 TaxID=1802748 RepID=A0A1G2TF71_9BACT|nr:MAG: hypothetical protein A2829_00455 [Candidatus Zambryskibacteria bacterium RIFCSPHIGHO2_01_FULL_43_60]OHA95937.1 MAG: hypothetical protein A3C70_02940 [Candidatus Zambryskibacteria bacterium RIFCSPHIGHO2_02_FULL_43_14]